MSPGVYAVALRATRAATGQSGDILELGRVAMDLQVHTVPGEPFASPDKWELLAGGGADGHRVLNGKNWRGYVPKHGKRATRDPSFRVT